MANPGAGQGPLQSALDNICSNPQRDCGPIQPGGPCYEPNTVVDHASYALNLDYKAHGATRPWCPADLGILTLSDPCKLSINLNISLSLSQNSRYYGSFDKIKS